MQNDYLEKILTARVYDVAIESPLEPAPNLSRRIQNAVLLKREDLQPVFSFKLRGAYNKMVQLPRATLKRGVIAASAGNHAQGVALSAQRLKCEATIVMPATTPQIKVDAVQSRGAQVVLYGDSYSDAYVYAMALAKERKLAFIHPYDDPEVIAGQGTIGMEILRQHPGPIHAIFVPVGGGGLIAGIAAYVKRLKPEIKIIGVEPVDADAMYRSLKKKERVTLAQVGIFADGVAVKQVGEETFRLCRELVDEVILVDTDAICAAIKDVFEDTRSILEPAGALSIAGAKLYAAREKIKNKTLVTIASGANMNFDRLRHVAERAELGEQREAVLAVTIPEKPGSFKAFCALIGTLSITEFNYRYADSGAAHVFVGVQVRNRCETEKLLALLERKGLKPVNMSDNEMAKLHVRHMVGGHAPQAKNETLYRFEFPERPGALVKFLDSMGQNWNISLFHYRNHGADYGRVLVGIQVPPQDKAAFKESLKRLGYPYVDESKNPAYKLFLG
ncbi:MAG: PLP-dependent threonine dehydratase [Betaproteobacteria bacterium CG2_30_59_46]|nr:MAG: PLP-dependent threonine dehydratase [Betaproteobacteria bacterium CG2_30_59_46]PIQ13217.1 MAG: threonine ammonia-lyase, biosynthetic [Hydrogenophilales bacterium CG18_big_fil_WC_8_21_14_2_50_58_12]PIX98464.1 MAG: threonine ammonia-lyase, biosynthetic [Hydrogenophilales bacterium CG_4_10_14_3_um_filter_58_23]